MWAYKTTQKTSIRENPFLLTYGTKAIILAEIECPSYGVGCYISKGTHLDLRNNLDLLEETRLITAIKNKVYKNKIAYYHNVKVKNKIFKLGDIVLRKLEEINNKKNRGKLALRWDNPFQINKNSKD